MKLLTRALARRIPRLNSTDSIPLDDKLIVAKFFTPDSNWTWFVVEAEAYVEGSTDEWDAPDPPERKAISLADALVEDYDLDSLDILFFGAVRGFFEPEWGYFALSELKDAHGPWGLAIERDRWWTPIKWSDVPAYENGH